MLTTENLSIGYSLKGKEPKVLLTEATLALKPGELVCLLGPNGAGKSTLIRTLAGLQKPLAGTVQLNDISIAQHKPSTRAQQIALVLTKRIQTGLLTAYDLVALGRHPHTQWTGSLSAQDKTIIEHSLAVVQASNLAQRNVQELSDGEYQKIMIARGLAQDTPILLLDEPTAFLDIQHRVEIIHILRQLAREKQVAILMSTHDLELAVRSAHFIWLLTEKTIKAGAPEDLIIDQSFQNTFTSAQTEFDALEGFFRLKRTPCETAYIAGEGIAQTWTQKALKRIGYAITEDPNATPHHIKIVPQGKSYSWQFEKQGETITVKSIYELEQALTFDNSL